MKYLYQQLLAFWSMIILIILIVGFSFTQLSRQTIEENNYQQLFGYADSVQDVSQNFLEQGVDNSFVRALSTTEKILANQGLSFLLVTVDNKYVYPEYDIGVDFSITDGDWEKLKAGKKLKVTDKKNIYGQEQTTSYAMVPVALGSEFYGVLIVSQPAKNVDDSVRSMTVNLFKGFIFSSIVAVIISYFFALFQVKRINRMKRATKEIANGNFDVTIPVHDKDEFDELAEDFNKMASSLKASQEEIERQEERRRQFMADASHEMRTPLTTINGLLEGLEYNAIPEDQKQNAITLMQNETARLIRLVNENLDYEKIRTNQISMVIKKFDATATLATLVVQLKGKAEAANNQLILETTESVDIYADYDRFVQIIVNILQNAIQFTKDGEIRLSVEKGYLETIVKISDTGIGMSEEQVANIWDRYYKVDPSRKNTKYGESGLGLPIVQQLVRLHKGKIEVQSQLGSGTTFTITFPDTEIE